MDNGAFAPKEQMLHFPYHFQIHVRYFKGVIMEKRALKGYSYAKFLERSGSVVECLTPDRRAVSSSLTGASALCP